jgi:nickel superoxide dismutase
MFETLVANFKTLFPAEEVSAHCDGPCGVYDPAQARVTAEAVLSMTKKLLAMGAPTDVASANTFSRYVAIKEEQAHETKEHLLVLWTDYFKPVHLEKYPDLHDKIWQATKLCSACKVEVSLEHAEELMSAVEEIHNIFWATKGRDVPWIKAS